MHNTYFIRIFETHNQKTKTMKLKCNVCKESPTVDVTMSPTTHDDIITCPCCDKLLAFVISGFDWTKSKYLNGLYWHPIDYQFNESFGGIPVQVVEI